MSSICKFLDQRLNERRSGTFVYGRARPQELRLRGGVLDGISLQRARAVVGKLLRNTEREISRPKSVGLSHMPQLVLEHGRVLAAFRPSLHEAAHCSSRR